jgi:hypothetical protein
VGESKSPDQYKINRNLVVNLNDSVAKPVKRENSNTTNATGVTAQTAATGSSIASQNKNSAFYNTQYNKANGGGQKGFFPGQT